MNTNDRKYPRTLHVPFSKSITPDDRRCEEGWFEHLKDKTLVLTEKLDGSQSYICKEGVYARSHAVPTTNPWDVNLFEKGGVYDQVKNLLSDEEGIYGENMYGIHSIEYDKLDTYFHMFAARDDKRWYSWDEVVELSNILRIRHVPTLEIRRFKSISELEDTIYLLMKKGSLYGKEIEGIVIRNSESFPIEDFQYNVVKYVRANHVQTDQHWKSNWKKAKLIYEKY